MNIRLHCIARKLSIARSCASCRSAASSAPAETCCGSRSSLERAAWRDARMDAVGDRAALGAHNVAVEAQAAAGPPGPMQCGGRPWSGFRHRQLAPALTQHSISINGTKISYTARAGHLVTTDMLLQSGAPGNRLFPLYLSVDLGSAGINSLASCLSARPAARRRARPRR